MPGTNIFTPALCRGISQHELYQSFAMPDYCGSFFHEAPMNGAYYDIQTWQGMGPASEHRRGETVTMDGAVPSFGYRIYARTFTTGTAIYDEDQEDDLYNIIHRLFPRLGGQWAQSFYQLKQILGAQFFGLYGFQTGTSVPYSPDGVSLISNAHPISKSNSNTWSNSAGNVDFSLAAFQLANALMFKTPTPNGIPMGLKIHRVMVHSDKDNVARQIVYQKEWEYGNADHNTNKYLTKGVNVEVVANPFLTYSGSSGTNNKWIVQADDHQCMWMKRSDLKIKTMEVPDVLATKIIASKRYGYGVYDPRGMAGGGGL